MLDAMKKTLVTIDGHIGSGGFDVGRKIARMFGWKYFDRVRLQAMNGEGRFDGMSAVNGATPATSDPRALSIVLVALAVTRP